MREYMIPKRCIFDYLTKPQEVKPVAKNQLCKLNKKAPIFLIL